VLATTTAFDEHVRGLDISVHEALLMGVVERVSDLVDDLRRARRLEPPMRGN
jgi:hypothetical protein